VVHVQPTEALVFVYILFLSFYVGIIGLFSVSVFGLVIVRDRRLLFCRIS
jgi:hypothetical protein